jgi:hypothetical protein
MKTIQIETTTPVQQDEELSIQPIPLEELSIVGGGEAMPNYQ